MKDRDSSQYNSKANIILMHSLPVRRRSVVGVNRVGVVLGYLDSVRRGSVVGDHRVGIILVRYLGVTAGLRYGKLLELISPLFLQHFCNCNS